MNHIYVLHPAERKPDKLCPRDEVAHPSKLADTISGFTRRWRSFILGEHEMFYLRIEYDKQFYKDVSSSHLYIATDSSNMTMFTDAHTVRKDSYNDMFEFLNKHYSSKFMVTCPVFELQPPGNIVQNIYYSIQVSDTQTPVFLSPEIFVEIRDLVNNRCYTVCNGLIFFLAMVREKMWNTRVALNVIANWRENIDGDISESIDINGVWQQLYMEHPIPMIGDFPAYYATMYPSVPCSFYKYIKSGDTVPLSQYIDDNNGNNTDDDTTICMYATPITSMFPYFNRDIFRHYNNTFGISERRTTIFETPYELEDNDHQSIDIEGMFISILRSKRAWKWWSVYGPIYLRKAWEMNGSTFDFCIYCYQVLFHLYNEPLYTVKYSHTKVRSIWIMALTLFNTPPTDMKLFLNILYVKNIIYENFNIRRWHPMPPVAFMKDLLGYYRDTLNWFSIHKNKIYTTHSYDRERLLSILSPYIHISNKKDDEFMLKCSMYQLMKLDTIGRIFVKYMLDKNISRKLICVDKIFGLKDNTEPIVNLSSNSAYEVGMILKDYLRSHRDVLI